MSARLFLLATIVPGTLALAQDAATPAAERAQRELSTTFSARVNLVSVPVVVRDHDGKAVGGLRQEDFKLFDKGKPQIITKFSVEASQPLSEGGASRTVPGESQQPAAAAKPALPARYAAYFFDDINLKPGDLLQMRQAAHRQMDQTFDGRTRAGLFTTSGRVTQDFTNEPAMLHAAVDRIQPWSTPKPDKQQQECGYMSYYVADQLVNKRMSLRLDGIDQRDPLLNAVKGEVGHCVPAQEIPHYLWSLAQRALNAGGYEVSIGFFTLLDLIKRMSVLPGSRSIVMVSPGFVITDDHRFVEEDLFDKAIRANVVINTLDARGLYTPSIADATVNGPSPGDDEEKSVSSDTLAEFAYSTGGTFFHNDNGLAEGLQQLAAAPEYVYVLGFSPDNLKPDGSYHGLKVTLKNGASLTVEARRGYWAPNHVIGPEEQARADVKDAVFSRDELLDIPVKVNTEFFKLGDAKAELTVESRVDLSAVKFVQEDGRNRDNLIVVTGLFDDNGRYIQGIQRKMDMRLRDQTLDAGRKAGLAVKETFEIPPGNYIVRVVVRDESGHSIAAKNEGVDIP